MSRFRRYQGRRRYVRRKKSSGFFGTASKALATAGTALALARGIKSLMNVEYKHHDRNITATNITDTSQVACLNLIAQGDDEINRNGNSIKAIKLNARYRITFTSGSDTTQYVRVMFFQDMHSEGDTPVGTDVLDSDDVMDYLNPDNTDRYKILYDRTHGLTAEKGGIVVKKNFKMNCKLEYIGASGIASHLGGGAIWMLWIGTQDTSNYPIIDAKTRLRYIDN